MKKVLFFFIISLLLINIVFAFGEYNILEPNSFSKWSSGKTYEIRWDNKGDTVQKVKIRLFTSAGVKVLNIIDNTLNDGSFKWKVPEGVSTGKYIVRVKNLKNTKGGDSRDFEIKSQNKQVDYIVVTKVSLAKMIYKPRIESMIPVPLGAIKPGSLLLLAGVRFGTGKGKILIKGNFPNGRIELENVKWESDRKASGQIPQSANGQPNQKVDLVIVTTKNHQSDPWKFTFAGREEKVLTNDAVVMVQCGTDSNCNVCNNFMECEHIGLFLPLPEIAIRGLHYNNWGAIGDDDGNDMYSINLKNGWVLKSMKIVKWYRSSGDEVLTGPTPPFPAGKSIWNPVIHWKVTPNDRVSYHIKIIVEGPIGTNYY